MSIRHQYIELQDNVYKRYIKSSYSLVAGIRPNPHDVKQRTDFLLKTPEDNVSWSTETNPNDKDHTVLISPNGRKIVYEDEVLETYSEVEDKVFRQLNKKLFEQGALVEYHESRNTDIDMSNALTDDQIFSIANAASIPVFKKKIKGITSPHTLDRIQQSLDNLERKPSFKQALAEYRDSLKNQ